MKKTLREILPVIVAAVLMIVCAASCSSIKKTKDISVTSCGLKYIAPTSTRSVEGVLLLGLDNPGISFKVSSIEGCVKRDGAPIGYFTAGEIVVEGKTSKVYELPVTASLAPGTSVLDLLVIAAGKSFEGIKIDITLNVGLKKGPGKTLTFKDIELKNLL